MTDTDSLTPTEAGELIGVSRNHMTTLAREGTVKAYKDGKFWRIDRASALRYGQKLEAKKPPKILDDAQALEAMYQELGTLHRVADLIGCDKATVANALRRHGIAIQNRREAARPTYVPQPVEMERWMDVAIIYLRRGLRPPHPDEMCPPNCPGRDDCLDRPGCKMNGNGNRRTS